MTVAWLLAGIGVLVMGFGVFVASGSAALTRIELYRWVAQQRPGSVGASVLLSEGPRVRRRAATVATVGALLLGLGTAGAVSGLTLPIALSAVAFVMLPVIAVVGTGIADTLGTVWSDAVLEHLVPRFAKTASQPSSASPPDSAELSALSGVLDFTERAVREVMTPRTEIVALREGASVDEVARVFADSGYSRIAVYRESLDEIVGMIYVFDLLKIVPGAELPIREVTSVPGSTHCTQLLGELQRQRRQFAVVLDEYGGTDGIVTVEDLLEELVGEIFEEVNGTLANAGTDVELVELSGSTPLDEIRAHFGVELPAYGETVSGLLAHVAGQIPRAGDRFAVRGLEFDVLSATATRVERVIVRRGSPPTASWRE